MSTMSLTTEGDRFVIVTRRFAAPPEEVYRAQLEPEIIRQWLLGPPGWTMPTCIDDETVGGKLRYGWADAEGTGFFLTGEVSDLDPPHRGVGR